MAMPKGRQRRRRPPVRLLLLLLLALLAALVADSESAAAVSKPPVPPACRDARGAPVAWWAALKAPRGAAFLHADAADASTWRAGSDLNNEAHSPTHATLAPLLAAAAAAAAAAAGNASSNASADTATLALFAYNDDEPTAPGGRERWDRAHAKGVLAFDGAVGVWLLHSAPRWPDPGAPRPADLAPPQQFYGQHFFCLAFQGGGALGAVAAALLHARPFVYLSALPPALGARFPALAALAALGPEAPPPPPQQGERLRVFELDAGPGRLAVFSKPAADATLPHDGPIAAHYGARAMGWETWRLGPSALPSSCGAAAGGSGGSDSLNIDALSFLGNASAWPWSFDHAKWGVGLEGEAPWCALRGGGRGLAATAAGGERQPPPAPEPPVCFGDLNREAGQRARGGNFVCARHAPLARLLRGGIAALECCGAAVGAAAA
jgi:deoxyribonuclease-2